MKTNPKSEILNTKQIQMFKIQNSKQIMECFGHWNIWILDLFSISCLEFRILLIAIYCALNFNSAWAGVRPDIFLDYGISARPAGMAGAYTALADDVDSLHWNPAGLDSLSRSGVSASASSIAVDLNYAAIGSAHRLGPRGTIGISWARISSPDIEITDTAGNRVGDDNYTSDVILFGFGSGHPRWWWLSWGVAGKYFRQKFGRFNEQGVGVSSGVKARFGILNLGLNVQEIGGMRINGDSFDAGNADVRDIVPAQVRTGIGIDYKHRKTKTRVLGAVDILDPFSGDFKSSNVNVGGEIAINNRLYVRGGWVPDTAASVGMAFHVRKYGLDYGLILTKRLAEIHRVSLTYFYGS